MTRLSLTFLAASLQRLGPALSSAREAATTETLRDSIDTFAATLADTLEAIESETAPSTDTLLGGFLSERAKFSEKRGEQ